jgi:hypothetical protein
MTLMTVLTSLVLAFTLYLLNKLYRLVKFRDLPMILSVISLTLSLLCNYMFKNNLI